MKMCKYCTEILLHVINSDLHNIEMMKTMLTNQYGCDSLKGCSKQFLDNDNKVKSCLKYNIELIYKYTSQLT